MAGLYQKGDRVEVWSNSQQAWFFGIVLEVGFGENKKWVGPEDVAKTIRRCSSSAAGSAAPEEATAADHGEGPVEALDVEAEAAAEAAAEAPTGSSDTCGSGLASAKSCTGIAVPDVPSQNQRPSGGVRWGTGLEAPAAGARQFIPDGWIPECPPLESVRRFGTPAVAVDALNVKATQKQQSLAAMDILKVTPAQALVVMAYTEENPALYPELCRAMRSRGTAAEKRLNIYRTYIYNLDQTLRVLPTFTGTVYRGLRERLRPDLYEVGKVVTWQSFSSATKFPLVTQRFLSKEGLSLSGSLFIILSNAGKEIDELSTYPEEGEVLFGSNSFFSVTAVLTGSDEKRSAVPDLLGYNLDQVDMYELEQL